ncbi:MAG: hypothetical protein ABSC94_30625 [Polyangiaceae bacterium]
MVDLVDGGVLLGEDDANLACVRLVGDMKRTMGAIVGRNDSELHGRTKCSRDGHHDHYGGCDVLIEALA